MPLPELFQNVSYVTLKLTNGCNLSCSYCNVEALTPQTPKMSMELFKRVARLLIENSQWPQVGLEFHGGEPLLLADEWFAEAVAFATELADQHGKSINFPLVTNGTMLTAERLQFLHKLGILFCISCDGPPEINDIYRQSGTAVQRAIRLFQEQQIDTGIITVVSQGNYHRMREVMDWYQSIDVADFRVNFVQPQGRGMDSTLLDGSQMFQAMEQVLDHMVDTNVAVFESELVSHITRFIEGRDANPGLSCWEFECQAGRTYVALDLFGNIHACGTDLTNHVIGHVDQEFDRQVYEQKLKQLHDKGDWVLRCFDCPAKRICNHSCPTSDYNSDTYKEYECDYTIRLWNHFCDNPERPQQVYETISQTRPPMDGSFVPLSVLERNVPSS